MTVMPFQTKQVHDQSPLAMQASSPYKAVKPVAWDLYDEEGLRGRLQQLRLSRLLPKILRDVDLWQSTVAKAVAGSDNVSAALSHSASEVFVQQLEAALLPTSRRYTEFAVWMFSTSETEKPNRRVATTVGQMLQLLDEGYWPDGDLLRFLITTKVFVRNRHLQIAAREAALKAEGLSRHARVLERLHMPNQKVFVKGQPYPLPVESISRAQLVTLCLGVVRPFSTKLLAPLELENDDAHFYVVQAAVRAIDVTMEAEMDAQTQIGCLLAAAAVLHDAYVYAMLACEVLDLLKR